MPVPSAVIFDFHDTLVHLEPSTNVVLAHEFGTAQEDCEAAWDRTSADIVARRQQGTWPPPGFGDDPWPPIYEIWLGHLGRVGDAGRIARKMESIFCDPTAYAAYPETAAVLRELIRRGILVGVLSNTDMDLAPILDATGLSALVDVAVPAIAHGVEKPDPEAFALVTTKLGVRPADCWFVGDHPEEDAVASAALGMTSILVARADRPRSVAAAAQGLNGVAAIDDLTGLLALLDHS